MIYLILILGLFFRLISLNQSLWLDEATTALASRLPLTEFFNNFMLADFHPPLYYLIIHYWSLIAGTSEIALRIPSVVFGFLTIYVVYHIAKELKFKWPLAPALFLATSGLHIYYSQEARMYSLVTFLVSYLFLLFIRKKWFLFSIILPTIFLTDYLSLLIYPALFIYTFLQNKKDIKKILLSLIPLAFVFILWLPTFYSQLSNGLAVKESVSSWWYILGPVTFKNVALIPIKFITGRISFDNNIIYILVTLIASAPFVYQISKAKNKLIWSWFAISLILGVFISFFIPTLTYFRYLFVLPAFYLLISENISKKLIMLILTINILSSGYYLLNNKFYRENWREAAKAIGSEKVVFPVNSQKEALIYYGKENNILSNNQLTNNQSTIWLSRYVWEIFDPSDLTRKYIEDLGYNKVSEANFNGVVLFKYANRN